MALKIYKYWQVLSFDVVVGAVGTAYLFSYALGVQIPLVIYLALALGVWLVYTLDHLIDASHINDMAQSPRHQFHQEKFTPLLIIWLLVLTSAAVLVLTQLDFYTIQLGIIASVFVLLHLVLVKLFGDRVSLVVQKEFGVALIFSMGVAIPALSRMDGFTLPLMLLFGQIFVLAFINLIEFSWFDYELDEAQGHSSIARVIGKKKALQLIDILFGVFLLFWISSLLWAGVLPQLVSLSMALALAAIRWWRSWFGVNDRYRVLGDLAFSFPFILLLYA